MTEQQIIASCQAGNSESFDQLYNQYFQKIYRFIYYKTSHNETTEDLTSLTFTKALEKLPKFDNQSGLFSAWLYKIARNNVIDYYRKSKPSQDIDQVFDLHTDDNLEEDMTKQQKLEKIKNGLEKLKPEQKEIVIMRVWDELSYKEISQIVGKSSDSCKMIFSRAIKQLKLSIAIIILFIISLTF